MYRCTWGDRVVVEIPGQQLVEGCPVYYPDAKEDPRIAELRRATPTPHAPRPTPSDALLTLLDHPSIASKRWVFEQYDSTVQASTVVAPGGDAGVIRVRHTEFAIAVTTDCNSRYVMLDPYEGGKAAVAEAARNVACTGARPLGITDCLNFGSPERPAVFHQFKEACRGIADACSVLGTPVTGGNVSFYNESPTGAVDPTPVVGMVGLLTRADRAVPSHARAAGDAVFVLGETRSELGGSAYWEVLHGFVGGQPPRVELDVACRLVDLLVAGAERGLFRSAHDCSQGGLGVALAEVAMGGPYQDAGFGMDIDLTTYHAPLTTPELLFSESHSRAVITCAPDRVAAVEALAREHGVPVQRVGTVGAARGDFRIARRDGAIDTIQEPIDRLREVYCNAIPRRMGD
jgi:phosphoribosylformylglycinamidine synthase